ALLGTDEEVVDLGGHLRCLAIRAHLVVERVRVSRFSPDKRVVHLSGPPHAGGRRKEEPGREAADRREGQDRASREPCLCHHDLSLRSGLRLERILVCGRPPEYKDAFETQARAEGEIMVTQARLSRGAVLALATIGCLAAGLLFSPAARVGWAAQMNDTFVWGKSGDADTLDNQVSSNGETSEVTTQVYNLLVRAKQGQTDIEPDLAESWSVSSDGLVWTFKLRKGVTFHDGTPWNAEAAKFNFDRMADAKNPYHAVKGFIFEYWDDFMGDTYKEARVVDPYTLQLVLNKPNAPLIYNLSIISFDMASPASFQKYGGEGVGQHPVGTGPYKFVEWIRDDHITLEANPSFFRKGLPKTRRVVMRVIKDNAARFLALRAGEIHAMELPNTDDVKVAQNDPTLKVGFRPPFNTGWVRFNMNNDLFKDKRIRQAVALAINRQAIIQGLYAGFGEVAQQHMPPSMWGRAQ